MDYQDELVESDAGFTKQLCAGTLVQHTLAPNSSLLAAAHGTGMLLVGASSPGICSALLYASASDLIAALKGSGDGQEEAPDVLTILHATLALPAPCQAIQWSPDDALAAIACTDGTLLCYTAQALAAGSTEPVAAVQCPPIRTLAWTPADAGAGTLLVLAQDFQLYRASLLSAPIALSPLRANVTALATSDTLVATATLHGSEATLTLSTLADDGAVLSDLVSEPLSSTAAEDAPLLIDALAFVTRDAVVAHVLALNSTDLENAQAANDEDEHVLFELDSPDSPGELARALLFAPRYHALAEPMRRPNSAGSFLPSRSPLAGPFMLAATFPAPFHAAILVGGGRSEDHFVHLFRGAQPADDESGTHWQEVANPVEGLRLNVPNTPGGAEDELFVPNFVIGAAAVVTHAGEHVHQPGNESAPPAQVRDIGHYCLYAELFCARSCGALWRTSGWPGSLLKCFASAT